MMSDSDDTDVLLLIPPNFFAVASSDSDDSSDQSISKKNKPSVVSELIDQMQSLEFRISAIESKDSSNNSLNLSRQLSLDSIMNYRQTLPRTKFSVSQTSTLQTSPSKYSQCSSLPSTPSIRQQIPHTNETYYSLKSQGNSQNIETNTNGWNKHDNLKLFSEPAFSQNASQNKSFLHAGIGSSKKELCSSLLPALNVCENNASNKSYCPLSILNSPSKVTDHFKSNFKSVKDMSLSEVEEFLQDIESDDKSVKTTNGTYKKRSHTMETNTSSDKINYLFSKDSQDKRKKMEHHKLKFNINGCNGTREPGQSDCVKKKDVSDFTLNDTSLSSFDTEKFMSEFKVWTPSFNESNNSKASRSGKKNIENFEKCNGVQQKDGSQVHDMLLQNYLSNTEFSADINKKESTQHYLDTHLLAQYSNEMARSQTLQPSAQSINKDALISSSKSCPSIFKTPLNTNLSNCEDTVINKSVYTTPLVDSNNSPEPNIISSVNNNEHSNQRPNRLLTLSDFWTEDSNKSKDEQLRIKLEEEHLRREHCEQLIQALQKKLLEQQEKLAVAIRIDDEKNSFISQFQITWKKTKQKLCEVESERENLHKLLQNISEKHHLEIAELQEQIKNYKEELSKALNLATGYKDKSDGLVQERVDILKNHANELQSYKLLVQQAESRYEEMKMEYQKLLQKNEHTEEVLKSVQQDLSKELSKSGEVRTEMAVIHKALDACETELTILRQEKENLQLKVKEEVNRNSILEQNKACLNTALEEARKSEKASKSEVQNLNEQQEKLRAELRDVYQKQVDEVVKAKLQEFQTELDSAETVFQNEIETKQRAIAECAARKIKSVIDKHQLEINLVEEKHKEEKRLFEIKLAQAMQKASMLEAQLNSYRKSKNLLVEQLHSMMQKQWQQALLIISGGNTEQIPSFQKINVDKLFDFPNEANLELIPKHCSTMHSQPMRLDSQNSEKAHNAQIQENPNESLVTLTSHEDTPLSSRKESKSDLRKYIKMILDMQQSKDERLKPKLSHASPPLSHKENTDKQVQQKDINTSSEGNFAWKPESEISAHDTSEYLSIPQKLSVRSDQKYKPPWK